MSSSSTVVPLRQPDTVDDPLTAVLRDGARRLLAQAVEAEAEAFLAAMREMRLPETGVSAWSGTATARSEWCRRGSARSRCNG